MFPNNEQLSPNSEIRLLEESSKIPIEDLLQEYGYNETMDNEDSRDSMNRHQLFQADIDCATSKANGIHKMIRMESGALDDTIEESTELQERKEVETKSPESVDATTRKAAIKQDYSTTSAKVSPSTEQINAQGLMLANHVRTPFLLRGGSLREYQQVGLDWLVAMYDNNLNGILADEMGLGKTIQTISLLSYLACERGIWGPHLIVVPTSVMLNWDMEFKRWCPAFKTLTYFGSPKERKQKRQGWTKPNSFHVCITSYKLVVQDQSAFRRKKWKFLILDEAQNIKNWRSQRWQTLLNFNSQRRLMLSGTPLQNNLTELWALLHFLMPHLFQSLSEFKEWFSNPLTSMVEGTSDMNDSIIKRLHGAIRPFILRRLKIDVEKQLPQKYEHVVRCRLSRRQRFLYEDFMARSSTRVALQQGTFLGMMNVLLQLRKVCNHPSLVEPRPIVSPFISDTLQVRTSSLVTTAIQHHPLKCVDFSFLGLIFEDLNMDAAQPRCALADLTNVGMPISQPNSDSNLGVQYMTSGFLSESHPLFRWQQKYLVKQHERCGINRACQNYVNRFRCLRNFLYSPHLILKLSVVDQTAECLRPAYFINPQDENEDIQVQNGHNGSNQQVCSQASKHAIDGNTQEIFNSYKRSTWSMTNAIYAAIIPVSTRLEQLGDVMRNFRFVVSSVAVHPAQLVSSPFHYGAMKRTNQVLEGIRNHLSMSTCLPLPSWELYFPDKRFVEWDCGKLQALSRLLRNLKSNGHRVLIFTQMTKVRPTLFFLLFC